MQFYAASPVMALKVPEARDYKAFLKRRKHRERNTYFGDDSRDNQQLISLVLLLAYLTKLSALEIVNGLIYFCLVVHYKWPIAH